MRRFSRIPGLAILALAAWSAVAEAQEVPEWSASLGGGVWLSEGDSEWRHQFLVAPGVLGGSRLRFKSLDATVVGADVDVVWRSVVLAVSGAWGGVDGGTLVDDDHLAGLVFSRQRSSVEDGHMAAVTVGLGARVHRWDLAGRRGFLDVLGGYQWWREEYEAFGVQDELGGGTLVPSSVKAITETWTWHSLRVGARTVVPLPFRLGVRASLFLLPVSWLRVEDIHHLRPDLEQDPSFETEAIGGFGWQAEAAVTYTFWRGLAAEVGYRHWSVEVDSGDVTIRAADGTRQTVDLMEASTDRSGAFFALSYRF